MTKTIKCIDTVIRSIKATKTRQVFWFEDCPGFGLRVTPLGTKSFVYKYMVSLDGKRLSRWLTLGTYPQLSLRKARREYDHYFEQVTDYGLDPVRQKQEHKEQLDITSKQQQTLSEFISVYLEWERLKGKATLDKEIGFFDRDLIPLLGQKPIATVSASDIEEVQSQIIARSQNDAKATRGGRVAVKNGLAYTRQLFNLAKRKGIVETNPVIAIESLGVSGNRDRVLSFKEIWLLWKRLDESTIPPVTANALKFALVTMQRSTEIRHMRYAAIKSDEHIWQMEVDDTKNKKMHRVPLNHHALEIIDAVRPYTGASEYVFGAVRASSVPREPKADLVPYGESAFPQAMSRHREAIGIDDIKPHDLRRTGATWITAAGLPKLYARLMLNHSDGDRDVTGEVYVQYSYDFEKKRAADLWSFIVEAIIRCEHINDVPSLPVIRQRIADAGLL